ncbi:GDSL-type esterase/lipase family protein [Jiangella mangrovi]|uniref:Lysophospholipase L1-like esterase n=1 Tax=Jiangella mangrovi TaxID=1524084 RepID=A0A7W9GQ98_9ACTN|nr:GDSL-type esterase/lipase family protein [Jiangella mangrovi]MBB5787853.1 lysophospholipase L1-like esterase [Jiangella mangrovi]
MRRRSFLGATTALAAGGAMAAPLATTASATAAVPAAVGPATVGPATVGPATVGPAAGPAARPSGGAARVRVGTWGAGAYGLDGVTFGGRTGRFVVRTSVGGTLPRLRLSNVAGAEPITVGPVHLGLHAGDGAVVAGTNRPVTFGGATTVTIAAGAVVLGDPVDLTLPDQADLAVSVHLATPVAGVTGHSIAAQRSYLSTDGDHGADESATSYVTPTSQWYLIDELTVETGAAGGTVVCLGDSITDGVGSVSGTNQRWPDFLARRLLAAGGTLGAAGVVNAGISGNRVLWDGASPNSQARLDRDVLSHPGVHAVVLVEGINDIASGKAARAGDLLAGYRQIGERLGLHGIRFLCGTVTPWLGSASWTEAKEAIRQEVNAAVRAAGGVDFDLAVRDPDDPRRLRAEYDSGGGVHLTPAGYRAMADAVDLALLDPARTPTRSMIGVGP